MTQLIDQFRHRLFSGRRYDHSTNGVTVTNTPYQGSCWVVSRALCSYHLIDLNHVDQDIRLSALENTLIVQSPYETPGYWVAWRGGYAQVWVWDKEQIGAAVQLGLQSGDQAELVEILPDSAYSSPLEDGLVLVQGIEGVTCQYWQSSLLRAERFWPDRPDEAEIQGFVRGAGARVADVSLTPEALSEVPWRGSQDISVSMRRYESLVVTAAALILAFLMVFELTTGVGLQSQVFVQSEEIAELEEASAPILLLREQVLDVRDRNHALAALRGGAQLELMARITSQLPASAGDSGRVKEWAYSGNDLEFTIQKPSADLSTYAKSLDEVAGIGGIELVPNDRSGDLFVRVTVE